MKVVCALCIVMIVTVSAAAGVPAISSPPGTSESRLAEAAAGIPGFGGFYYDSDGRGTVYIVGHTESPEARARFGADVRIRSGQYSFVQLREWRNRLRALLALPNAVSLDLNEGLNRVVLGIKRGATGKDLASIRREIAALNVPSAAVIIQESDPIRQTAQLTDYIRPQVGGVLIDYYPDSGPEWCTLGFNVAFEKGSGFVTCSHCTAVSGQLDYDNVGWGVEERDLPFFTGGDCPADRRCRWSDSALIYYAFVDEQGGGGIARPENFGTCSAGSTTISATSPRFYVTGTESSPYQGETLSKVGIATGWTTGDVTNTCFDARVDGTNITMLCQNVAGFLADFHDSGSPVFKISSGDNVTLYGILWGKAANCAGLFSDLASIQYEIGPFSCEG